MSDVIRILVVCTANICRSPYVEARLRAAVGTPQVVIESAGTRALSGAAMSSDSIEQLTRRGFTASADFSARQLNARMIERATLVLTMTREHRAQVLEISPLALKRTLTLREFSGLLEARSEDSRNDQAGAHWAQLVRECMARRSRHPELVSTERADLPDPYGLGTAEFERMAAEVEEAVVRISAAALPR